MAEDKGLKIILGADGYGADLKDAIKEHLVKRGNVQVEGFGKNDKYYEVAWSVACKVGAEPDRVRGVLCCGTGMGMSIIANKHPKVFAALAENPACAVNSRSINNSNVLAMGGIVTSTDVAIEIVDAWLNSAMTGPCPANGDSGWPDDVQEFLKNSMMEIPALLSMG
ncbi:hypothetical protein BSKO_04162 [Bryopsis sp. KO-2023]|nr:hypothetical protein BSKO_04162 [Bryopsis sp. KO-2023]